MPAVPLGSSLSRHGADPVPHPRLASWFLRRNVAARDAAEVQQACEVAFFRRHPAAAALEPVARSLQPTDDVISAEPIAGPSENRVHAIGERCVEGDRACEHGDLLTLGAVADRLVESLREPLHCELAELANQCRRDPARAVAAWYRLKERVLASDVR